MPGTCADSDSDSDESEGAELRAAARAVSAAAAVNLKRKAPEEPEVIELLSSSDDEELDRPIVQARQALQALRQSAPTLPTPPTNAQRTADGAGEQVSGASQPVNDALRCNSDRFSIRTNGIDSVLSAGGL